MSGGVGKAAAAGVLAWCWAFLASGCGMGSPPRATALDAERTHVALGELERGRSLLVTKCGGACHSAPLPAEHTAREWPSMLDEMSQRSGLTFGDRRLIEQYVVAFARE